MRHGFNWLRKKTTGVNAKSDKHDSSDVIDKKHDHDEQDTNVTVVNESDKSKMPRWAKLAL